MNWQSSASLPFYDFLMQIVCCKPEPKSAPDGSGSNQLEQPEVFLLVVKAQQWYTASSRN
jgi:hypothetical protein